MDYIEVRNIVVEIINNEVGCGDEEYVDNDSLIEDLGCDDSDMIEIFINLEDEFEVMFSIEDFDPYEDHTIKEISMLILSEIN